MAEIIDIAIIGSGVACTATIISVLEQLLENSTPSVQLNIAVIEKHNEFWKGVPYGSRSSVNALTITSIKDFFTDEQESRPFFDWFKANSAELLKDYENTGGATARQWLEKNSAALEREDWGNIYLPRSMVGKYIHEKLLKLLHIAEHRQLVKLELIQGEAIALEAEDGLYKLTVELTNQQLSYILSKKVVVAIGSAPERRLTDAIEKQDNQFQYINNLYEPNIDHNIARLKNVLINEADALKRNILIIGSNASCIELLYLLNNDHSLKALINNITLLSPSGVLPYYISYEDNMDKECIHLEKLKIAGSYTLEQLVIAAEKDIKATPKGEICIPYVDRVVGLTISLLQKLDVHDHKAFYGIYGTRLARLFRRSGPEYKSASEELLKDRQLHLLKGAYKDLALKGNETLLTYKNLINQTDEQHPIPFKIVINCTGSDHLINSSSRMINSLINHNNCSVNLSGKAFEVNENFEVAPNLYIIGPLIGGNVNKLIHFWHLENASRIMYLAPYLARELLSS